MSNKAYNFVLQDVADDRKLYISITEDTMQFETDDPLMDDFLFDLTDPVVRREFLGALIDYEIEHGGFGWILYRSMFSKGEHKVKTLLHSLPKYGSK